MNFYVNKYVKLYVFTLHFHQDNIDYHYNMFVTYQNIDFSIVAQL